MTILDMQIIRDANFVEKPYQYAKINNVFTDGQQMTLCDEYPQRGFKYCETLKDKKTYSMYMRRLFDSRENAFVIRNGLSESWAVLLSELLSDEYRTILAQHINKNLNSCHIEINCWQYLCGCWLSPHTDKPGKVVSQLFYFNDTWDSRWGGGFRVLNSSDNNDMVEEIFPDVNTSIVLTRSDQSWHSVEPLTCPERVRRKLLQIIFWQN